MSMKAYKDLTKKLYIAFKECKESINTTLNEYCDLKIETEDLLQNIEEDLKKKVKKKFNTPENPRFEDENTYSVETPKNQEAQFIMAECPAEQKDEMKIFQTRLEAQLREFEIVSDTDKSTIKGFFQCKRSVRFKKSISKTLEIRGISKKEFKARRNKMCLIPKPEFLGSINKASELLLKLVIFPSHANLEELNLSICSNFFLIKDQNYLEFSIQSYFYSICCSFVEKNNEAYIIGFGRMFKPDVKLKVRKIGIDGGFVYGKTIVIFEFKHHYKNKECPIDCVIKRNYVGKVKMDEGLERAIIIGGAAKGRSYFASTYKYISLKYFECPVIDGYIEMKRREEIVHSLIEFPTKSNKIIESSFSENSPSSIIDLT